MILNLVPLTTKSEHCRVTIQWFGLIHEACLGHRSGWLLGLGAGLGQKTLPQADIYSATRASEASGHLLFRATGF